MATEVKLSPGWLLRDVRKAAARLDPSQRISGSTASCEKSVAASEKIGPKQDSHQQKGKREPVG